MTTLYIQVENNVPVNHPAYEDNLIQAFGTIPVNWTPFVRIDKPLCLVYQVCDAEPVYEKVEGIFTDVWVLREMTPSEILAKQQVVQDAWAAQYNAANFSTWVFDQATCKFAPPIPYPETGDYRWSGIDNNWKEIPTQ